MNDLFFFMVYILGRKDINNDWLFDRCREVQDEPNGYLDVWARGHFKSSIITIGLSLQDIINDPETTICILSWKTPAAKDFLHSIRMEMELNENLRRLFPDIFWDNPERDAPRWSEDGGLVVRRKNRYKESTVEASGLVDGQPTGKHFKKLVYDDVVTPKSVTTPEQIKKSTDAWALSLNLGTEDCVRRTIGTFYSHADTYHEMIQRNAVKVRRHPATVDGTEDGEPVLLSREMLAEKRRDMGPFVYACQVLLDPTALERAGFRKEWLEYWPAINTRDLNIYILVDPASSKDKNRDYTSMFVVGLGADDVYRVITMVRDRLNLVERTTLLFELHRHYRPLGVGYEKYGKDSDIEHINSRMKDENYKFKITECGGKLGKPERIQRLIPLFEQGRVLLPEACWRTNCEKEHEDLTKIFVNEEYIPYPMCAHDDMMDALSRIFDIKTRRPEKRRVAQGPTHTNTSMRRLHR